MPVPPQRFASGGLSHLGVGTGPGRCPSTGGPVPRAQGRSGRVPVSRSRPVPADLGYETSASSPHRLRSGPRLSACPHTGVGHLSLCALISRRFLARNTLIKAPCASEDSNLYYLPLLFTFVPRVPTLAVVPHPRHRCRALPRPGSPAAHGISLPVSGIIPLSHSL